MAHRANAEDVVALARQLRDACDTLTFSPPVRHVYDPLDYAWAPHEQYLRRYATRGARTLLMGMNPGPWGMAQTGVPFGEVALVRDWLGITAPVGRPDDEHPKRPVDGFACPRSEVSGARLWGWAAAKFKTPDLFFDRFFVHNYCPLAFLADTGRNITPDKLPAPERASLEPVCDAALRALIETLQPDTLVGIGAFAEKRLQAAAPDFNGIVGRILHPSPASPVANRGWAEQAEAQLAALGIAL